MNNIFFYSKLQISCQTEKNAYLKSFYLKNVVKRKSKITNYLLFDMTYAEVLAVYTGYRLQ